MRLTKHICLVVTAMAIILPAQAMAQDADSSASTGSSDIIVTARRTEERLQDVPISISVYNSEQLASRNIISTVDLATYTPSLTVNTRFGPEKATFAIRGFSQDLNTLPTVGVYFADVVAPRITSTIPSGNGAGVGDMFDLQSVQVLKGPQGTLFGRNTTGGAVLLVPNKPTDRLEGHVEASVGSHDMWRGQAVINLPISDAIRLRAGVDRYKREGWLNNRSGVGPTDFNDSNYLAARVSLAIDLTPDLENYTIFKYARSHTNGSVGKVVLCAPDIPSPFGAAAVVAACGQLTRERAQNFGYYDVENSDPNADLLQRTWQAINTTTWRASDTLTIKNIVSYGVSKERFSYNLLGDYPDIQPGFSVRLPINTLSPGPNNPQGDQWTLTEELQIQGSAIGDRLNWQVGGYLERSKPNNIQESYAAVVSDCIDAAAFQCVAGSPVGLVSITNGGYAYRNYALYAQGTFKLTDRLSVTAGIRNTWDRVRQDSEGIFVVPSPTGAVAAFCSRSATPANATAATLVSTHACNRTFEAKSAEPTWLIDLEYKPSSNAMIYARYARGYRAGGVNEANLQAEVWKPEFVDDYEIGLKASFQGAVRGNIDISAFWNDFREQQVSVFIPQCGSTPTAPDPLCTAPAATGITGIQNVGKSRLRGVEVDGSLFFGDSVRFDLGYAFLDAKVTGAGTLVCARSSFACDKASFLTPGTALPYAPRNRVTVTGTYTLPLPESVGAVSVGATFTHTSTYFSNHLADPFFAAGAIPFNPSRSPATDLVNLNVSWQNVGGHPLDLSFFMTNVTGEKYYVASGTALNVAGAEYVFLGEPRMMGLRAKIRFGN